MNAILDRDKLARVLALLASDQPGEVVAAARAAGRMLAAGNLRFEDLAAAIPAPVPSFKAPPRPTQPTRPEPAPREQPAWAPKPKPFTVRDLPRSGLRAFLTELLAGDLSETDRAFLSDLLARLHSAPHKGLSTAEVRRLNRLHRTREAAQ